MCPDGRRWLLVILAASSLQGCIATGGPVLREDGVAHLTPGPACRYQWPGPPVEFRTRHRGIANPGWAYYSQGIPWAGDDEARLNAWFDRLVAEDLASACDGETSMPAPSLVAWYADYRAEPSKAERARVVVDIATVLSTLGSVPVHEPSDYLLCLEAIDESGAVAYSLATGRIKLQMNLWGMKKVEATAHHMVTEMMQMLLQQAWRSMWQVTDTEHRTNCSEVLSALDPELAQMRSRQEWQRLGEAPDLP